MDEGEREWRGMGQSWGMLFHICLGLCIFDHFLLGIQVGGENGFWAKTRISVLLD